MLNRQQFTVGTDVYVSAESGGEVLCENYNELYESQFAWGKRVSWYFFLEWPASLLYWIVVWFSPDGWWSGFPSFYFLCFVCHALLEYEKYTFKRKHTLRAGDYGVIWWSQDPNDPWTHTVMSGGNCYKVRAEWF